MSSHPPLDPISKLDCFTPRRVSVLKMMDAFSSWIHDSRREKASFGVGNVRGTENYDENIVGYMRYASFLTQPVSPHCYRWVSPHSPRERRQPQPRAKAWHTNCTCAVSPGTTQRYLWARKCCWGFSPSSFAFALHAPLVFQRCTVHVSSIDCVKGS